MIPLRVHNVLDYVIAVVLLAAPFLFGFSQIPAARALFLVLGFGLAGYSLLTKYRYSIAKIIPLGVHMAMDVITGLVVMIAPWVFGYSNQLTTGQTSVHFVLGLGALALVTFTRMRDEDAQIYSGRTRTMTTDTVYDADTRYAKDRKPPTDRAA